MDANRADSAFVTRVPAGAYTIHLASADNSGGAGLVEVYDVDGDDSAALINLSTRAEVSPGADVLIPGFVVTGTGAQMYMIRAIGPSLESFNVANPLPDPQLTLYRDGVIITLNDNWSDAGNADQTAALAANIGAFALPVGSADAAVSLALSPGSYTVHVSGAEGTAGSVLVEIYAVE